MRHLAQLIDEDPEEIRVQHDARVVDNVGRQGTPEGSLIAPRAIVSRDIQRIEMARIVRREFAEPGVEDRMDDVELRRGQAAIWGKGLLPWQDESLHLHLTGREIGEVSEQSCLEEGAKDMNEIWVICFYLMLIPFPIIEQRYFIKFFAREDIGGNEGKEASKIDTVGHMRTNFVHITQCNAL